MSLVFTKVSCLETRYRLDSSVKVLSVTNPFVCSFSCSFLFGLIQSFNLLVIVTKYWPKDWRFVLIF